MDKETLPKFATEVEEAEWWYEQRDRLSEKGEKALARGELKPRRLTSSSVTEGTGDANTENATEWDILRLSYENLCPPDEAPPSERQLWRFMDLAKFVSMFNHQGLYFCVLDALGDRLEGALPEMPPEASDWDRKTAWSLWCSNRATVFVNCWHWNDDESAAMWRLYASQGVAIRTTFGRLSRAVHQRPAATPPNRDRMVVGGMVTYTDPGEIARPDLRTPFPMALKKRRWYEYEHEFRLMYHLPSNALESASSPQAGLSPKRKGVWVACDLAQAISEIVLAPSSPLFLEDAVKAVTEKFGLSPSLVKRSRIEEGAPTPPEVLCLADLKPTSAQNP